MVSVVLSIGGLEQETTGVEQEKVDCTQDTVDRL